MCLVSPDDSLALVALRDIRVASGTQLAPSLLNWQLTPDHRSQASGDSPVP